MSRRRQNNGVVVTITSTEYYGGRDPIIMKNDYFGVLKEIVELDYFQNNQ